ncbi:hypothetical protein HDE_09959 [Halotydeus destructor]|nr:hypothetical protein HDE_09959 [Halotydeus destructor]
MNWMKISPDANLQIYQFLPIWDLLAVGATCHHFQELIAQHLKTLRKVDLRLPNPQKASEYKEKLETFILTKFGSNLRKLKVNDCLISRQWICEELSKIYPQIVPTLLSSAQASTFLSRFSSTFLERDANDLTLRRTTRFHYANLCTQSRITGVRADFSGFQSFKKETQESIREELAAIDTFVIHGIDLGPKRFGVHFERFVDLFPNLKTILIRQKFSNYSILLTGAKMLRDYVTRRGITLLVELSFDIGNPEVCQILSPFATTLNLRDGYFKAEFFYQQNYFDFKNVSTLKLKGSQVKHFFANSQFFQNYSLKLRSIAVLEIGTSHIAPLKQFLLHHGNPLEELSLDFDDCKPVSGVGSLIKTIRPVAQS